MIRRFVVRPDRYHGWSVWDKQERALVFGHRVEWRDYAECKTAQFILEGEPPTMVGGGNLK